MQDEAERSNNHWKSIGSLSSICHKSKGRLPKSNPNGDRIAGKRQVAQKSLSRSSRASETLAIPINQEPRFEEARQEKLIKKRKLRFDLLDQVRKNRLALAQFRGDSKNHVILCGRKECLEAPRLGGIVGLSVKNFPSRRVSDCLKLLTGASSQHIIVEDEGAATRAIEHLKNPLRSGQPSFLAATSKPRYLAGKESRTDWSLSGFLGMANSLREDMITSLSLKPFGCHSYLIRLRHAKAAALGYL